MPQYPNSSFPKSNLNGEELTEDSILNFLHNYSESIPFEEDYKENEIIEIEEYTGSQGKVEGFQEINEDDFWFIDAKTGMIIPRKDLNEKRNGWKEDRTGKEEK